jgi:hypothetical protein
MNLNFRICEFHKINILIINNLNLKVSFFNKLNNKQIIVKLWHKKRVMENHHPFD